MLKLFLMVFYDSKKEAARQKTENPEQDEVDGDKGQQDHVCGQEPAAKSRDYICFVIANTHQNTRRAHRRVGAVQG
jgi:hypothetical protein